MVVAIVVRKEMATVEAEVDGWMCVCMYSVSIN